MKIVIVGGGQLGILDALKLAGQSHLIEIVDSDQELVTQLNSEKFTSPQLLVTRLYSIVKGHIHGHAFPAWEKFSQSAFVICLPTDLVDGSIDTSLVEQTVHDIREHHAGALIVIRSTVTVDCIKRLQAVYQNDSRLVYFPELAERDYSKERLHPRKVIIGATNSDSASQVANLYEYEFQQVGLPEAALIKLAVSSFLAAKVNFVNSLEEACSNLGLNAIQVLSGFGSDSRIGKSHTNPSFGFGGRHFVKDVQGLISHTDTGFEHLTESNENRASEMATRLLQNVKDGEFDRIIFYRMFDKQDSTTTEFSATENLINAVLGLTDKNLYLYEPLLTVEECSEKFGSQVIKMPELDVLGKCILVADRVDANLGILTSINPDLGLFTADCMV